jgi:hypothetical protein
MLVLELVLGGGMLLPVCEGSALLGIGAAPLAVPLDRCVPVPEFRILSRTSGFGISPGFRLFSVVPGSWVFSGPVPVLVPVLVDSLAELLKVLVEKLRRSRRCFCGIPEFDLDRIEGSDESRSGDFGHSTYSTIPEFLDLQVTLRLVLLVGEVEDGVLSVDSLSPLADTSTFNRSYFRLRCHAR